MQSSISGYLNSRKLRYTEDYDLSSKSYIKIGGKARFYVEPGNKDELVSLLRFLVDAGVKHKIIGKLTNTLVLDEVYDGVIIGSDKLQGKSAAENVFTVECGCTLASFLAYASRLGYGGAEQLWLIPGSVGGSIRGNAGAHGLEIGDIFLHGEVFSEITGSVFTLSKEDMAFSYRHSALKDSDLYLINAKFSLSSKERNDIFRDLRVYRDRRLSSQPISAPSLGSIFKRVNGMSAGYYIDRAGLKGFTYGGAMVSPKHAGFIVNVGGAKASDVIALITIVKEQVFARFGVALEEEIEILN